ncbi:MAG: mannose-1-phosphate guanylyltransferase/mannose-6-phosphate isomerase [Acidimicrobiia bacterium]|nr:MAG: mannose-1-phosphate guanylyltransferase/mannose-6-phosphate isomerase [Acidimicrobiia bacterium]
MQPKQLLPLVDDRSMMRATIDRVSALDAAAPPIIVTNEDHADAITREMVASGYPEALLILEPVGRNTAPAVAVAAYEAMTHGDPLLLVLPADHTITDERAFQEAIGSATEAACSGYLVTFGITPSRPETGYGYIKVGSPITSTVKRVNEFKEKPDQETANAYFESGEYLWNSGMFLIRASIYLTELENLAPDIAASSAAAHKNSRTEGNRLRLDAAAFTECRADSVDYAVMERTSMAAVVPTDPGWNDVGTWESLWDIAEKDAEGNVLVGDVLSVETSGSYVKASDRLVATVGIDNMVVVDTPDAVLVANRDAAQDVRKVVEILKREQRSELDTDGTELRPWGRFVTIDSGEGYRVLHLWLDPGGKTSLKSHRHRSENWLVIKGVARITTGETSRLVPTKESVYIPSGEIHRLENPGDDVLEVIEVDVGSYVGEDDIKRHMDAYGRTERKG